jgi:hypothetical protein
MWVEPPGQTPFGRRALRPKNAAGLFPGSSRTKIPADPRTKKGESVPALPFVVFFAVGSYAVSRHSATPSGKNRFWSGISAKRLRNSLGVMPLYFTNCFVKKLWS